MLARYLRSFDPTHRNVRPPSRVSMYDAPSGRAANWAPDPEEEILDHLGTVITPPLQWFEIDQLTEDKLLLLSLRGAEYALRRVNEEDVKLWSSRGGIHKRGVGFVGKLRYFGMIDTAGMTPAREVDFYPGVVAVVGEEVISHVVMPYFQFNTDGQLQAPETVWVGSVQGIQLSAI